MHKKLTKRESESDFVQPFGERRSNKSDKWEERKKERSGLRKPYHSSIGFRNLWAMPVPNILQKYLV
jgi:hypothetical protein